MGWFGIQHFVTKKDYCILMFKVDDYSHLFYIIMSRETSAHSKFGLA